MTRYSLALILAFNLAACTNPTEQVQTLDERPALLIQGAPAGARLVVNGLDVGSVATAAGTAQAIRIQPGTHVVEVTDAGRVLLHERLFVSGGAVKTLTVPGRAP